MLPPGQLDDAPDLVLVESSHDHRSQTQSDSLQTDVLRRVPDLEVYVSPTLIPVLIGDPGVDRRHDHHDRGVPYPVLPGRGCSQLATPVTCRDA